jgi:hypothetical protein
MNKTRLQNARKKIGMDENSKKLIQLRTKLEFYKKLEQKMNQVFQAELELEDWSDEVYLKISRLEVELEDLKMEMDLPDEKWYEDEID